MNNQYYARFVTENEYKACLKERQPFIEGTQRFYLMVEPIEYFDSVSFRAYLLYKRPSGYSLVEGNWAILNENDQRTISPLVDYTQNNTPFYLTFEGITFYKVNDIRINKEENLEFFLSQMTNQIFVDKNRSFMIMPFGNAELNDFYKNEIREYLKTKMEITVYRADDFNDNDVIIDTIYREIEKAEFVICEVSGCNKNVFFEIGYAKAMKKELILLLQRGVNHNFFDVAHIRRIEYDVDNPVELQEKLKDTIETIRGKR